MRSCAEKMSEIISAQAEMRESYSRCVRLGMYMAHKSVGLSYELELLHKYLRTKKNKLSRSRLLKVKALQTDAQINRWTRPNPLSRRIGRWQKLSTVGYT